MIKLLRIAFFVLFAFAAGSLSAQQACTPDPLYTSPGIHPDSATGFAPAYAGSPYVQLVTIVVPLDTQAFPPPFPPTEYDSIVLVSLTGLPPGFTYACYNVSSNPNRCSWPGNTTGCLQIDGNPTIVDTGTYNLLFTGNAYLGGSTTPASTFTIDYYKIVVYPPQSVNEVKSTIITAQNSPNPFHGKTRIHYSAAAAGDVELVVYNMLGSSVYSTRLKAHKGNNEYEFSAGRLLPGVYIYTLNNGSTTVTRRMVIEGK